MGRDKGRGNTLTRARASGLARAANILSRRCRVLIRVAGVCPQTSGASERKREDGGNGPHASLSVRSPDAIFKSRRLLSTRGQEGMAGIKMADAKKELKNNNFHFCIGCLPLTIC